MNNRVNEARADLDAMNKSHTAQAAIYRACGYTLGSLTHHEAPTKRLVNALKKAMPDMVFTWEPGKYIDPMIHAWGGSIDYDKRLSIYFHSTTNGSQSEPCNPIQYGADHCKRMAIAYDDYIVANNDLDVDRLAQIEAEVAALMVEAEDLTAGGTTNTNYDARRAFRALWPERR